MPSAVASHARAASSIWPNDRRGAAARADRRPAAARDRAGGASRRVRGRESRGWRRGRASSGSSRRLRPETAAQPRNHRCGVPGKCRSHRVESNSEPRDVPGRCSLVLAAFTAGQGYCADADHSPRAWLMHKTGITKGAAAGHLAWSRRAAAYPQVVAALAGAAGDHLRRRRVLGGDLVSKPRSPDRGTPPGPAYVIGTALIRAVHWPLECVSPNLYGRKITFVMTFARYVLAQKALALRVARLPRGLVKHGHLPDSPSRSRVSAPSGRVLRLASLTEGNQSRPLLICGVSVLAPAL